VLDSWITPATVKLYEGISIKPALGASQIDISSYRKMSRTMTPQAYDGRPQQ